MYLVVEQLIYSSFDRLGFKYIASRNVPLSIQQIFYQNIVSRLWDTYNPPAPNHAGVYIYQIEPDKTLFGWLTNDGYDEFGRANIPYFHCYYLTESLDSTRLVKILACLEAGPIERVARDQPIDIGGDVAIADDYRSNAPELGVKLSKDIRLFSHRQIRERKLLQWYVAAKEPDARERKSLPPDRDSSLAKQPDNSLTEVNTSDIGRILLELMAKPIAIEAVALVSPEGQLLARAIGIEENSSLILSGTMLYLANNTLEELAWDRVEQIVIRGQQGNLILTACTTDAFLLVKTGKVLSGLLEGEIQKARARLQKLLENPLSPLDSPSSVSAHPETNPRSPFDTIFYGFDSNSDKGGPDRPENDNLHSR